MDELRGLLMVFTGAGKGKTTAAMGNGLRAAGHGQKVLMVQFIKGSWHYGELDAAPLLNGCFEIRVCGRGFVKKGLERPDPEDVSLAEAGWQGAVDAMHSGQYDMLILDEVNYALHYGMLSVDRVVGDLRTRPPGVHVICTGRHADPQLIELADLVTEMKDVKHHYRGGIRAQKGIEY